MTFPKLLTKDMKLAGVTIPKGNFVIMPIGWKRHNNNYINATEFRPERFEEEVPSLQKHIYVPFYDGRRKCIGYVLAQMNMNLLIGYMAEKCDIKVEKDYKIEMGYDAVYNVKNPIINLKLRTE